MKPLIAALLLSACATTQAATPAPPPQYQVAPAYFDALPELTVYGSKDNRPTCKSASCQKPYANPQAIVTQTLIGNVVDQHLSCHCYFGEAPKEAEEVIPPVPEKKAEEKPGTTGIGGKGGDGMNAKGGDAAVTVKK